MGILVIIGVVIAVVLVLAVVYSALIRQTRRERTDHGAHRAGPGRTSL
jgi:predicted RND superfamily exporter protein